MQDKILSSRLDKLIDYIDQDDKLFEEKRNNMHNKNTVQWLRKRIKTNSLENKGIIYNLFK